MSLSRLRSMRDRRNKKDKPRLFSGDLYGNDEKPKKPTSSGSASASAKLTASVIKADDSNVVVHLLWNTQSLLASAWGMYSSLPPFFSPQVPKIASELRRVGLAVEEETIKRVLRGRYAGGDPDRALDLLVMIEDSNDGIVARVKSDAETKLVGAENHGGTTCYLDTLFFAMFAKIDAFEAILYNTFDEEDQYRRKLGSLIRLYVNMVRSGKLVTTDITSQLLQTLAGCGWEEALSNRQQDPSEAFAFITDTLKLPLLTVKVDIAHGGKEVAEDDHKFISERLLNLSLPAPENGNPNVPIPLEACLEEYFHGRVDVTRQLERRRTIDSVHSSERNFDDLKSKCLHVETADLGSQPNTPEATPQTPMMPTPTFRPEKSDASGSSTGRPQKHSLVRTVEVESEVKIDGGGRKRAMTLRKEILLPAWCFFSVLPFYTDSSPQPARSTFAEHFSTRRPVLGLCLKRYFWTKDGPQRDPRRVDIPLEIALPTFVTDDEMGEDDGTLYGNFKLVLQSAICHRGNSVHSGHYIALIRGEEGKWLRFDDLALAERVTTVDHKTAFEQESPYMLFYQVQPIEDDEAVVTDPTPSVHSFEQMSEKRLSIISSSSQNTDGIPMSLEPRINEPPSYEGYHHSIVEFGTSPPPPYASGGGFLSLPEPNTGQDDNDLLRPSSRSRTRPGSRDSETRGGGGDEGRDNISDKAAIPVPRRSKSETAEKRSSWASLRLGSMTRGKSQDKLNGRKSSEWKNEEYLNGSAPVSEDSGERDETEVDVEKGRGKEKEREKSPKEKKEKGKGKEKEKGKEKKKEVRECLIQ